MPRLSRFAALLGALLCFLGCDGAAQPGVAEVLVTPAPVATTSSAPHGAPDTARGEKLVAEFECRRCHDGAAVSGAPIALEKHCVRCHRDIAVGKFKASAAKLAEWRPHVDDYTAVPSLTAIGARFEAAWVERYLLQPHDLRPHLAPTMPRLALSANDARDIAGYLTKGRPAPATPAAQGDRALGERLYRDKGCPSCHEFGGAGVKDAAAAESAVAAGRDAVAAYRLAPDLRYTRERFKPGVLGAWLEAPHAVKPDTPMPNFGLTRAEANGLAAYVLTTRLDELPRPSRRERLPRLERRVRFAEVDEKVFSVTCRHCHGDPEKAGGDGGPGNTGGFGFRPRKIDLSSYSGVMKGHDRTGERRSLFEPLRDGTPLLVAALVARIDEEMGRENPNVRGMPLGLPALSLQDIQLVETWISQGRPM